MLPPDSLPSSNQYLQLQNLFTSDSDERGAWTGVRSMALTRNARLRVRSRGIRFSELVGRPQISEPLVLLAVDEQNMSETKPILTERRTLSIVNPPQVAEKHFTPQELAELWKFDESTIRRMFIDEPGVLKYGKQSRRDGRRDYVTLRIPESVARRVYERRTR